MSDRNPFPAGSAGAAAWQASFGTPAASAPSPVQSRQALIAQNPGLDDAAITRLESRIAGEAIRAEVKAIGAQLDADWQAERQASQAEADALAQRIFGAAPETEEQAVERRRQAINRENLGGL